MVTNSENNPVGVRVVVHEIVNYTTEFRIKTRRSPFVIVVLRHFYNAN